MRVSDLIDKLKTMPQDAEIRVAPIKYNGVVMCGYTFLQDAHDASNEPWHRTVILTAGKSQ